MLRRQFVEKKIAARKNDRKLADQLRTLSEVCCIKPSDKCKGKKGIRPAEISYDKKELPQVVYFFGRAKKEEDSPTGSNVLPSQDCRVNNKCEEDRPAEIAYDEEKIPQKIESEEMLRPMPVHPVDVNEIERKGSESPTKSLEKETPPPVILKMIHEHGSWHRKYCSLEVGQMICRRLIVDRVLLCSEIGTIKKIGEDNCFSVEFDDLSSIWFHVSDNCFSTDVFTRHINPNDLIAENTDIEWLMHRTFQFAKKRFIRQTQKCRNKNCKDFRVGHLINFFH